MKLAIPLIILAILLMVTNGIVFPGAPFNGLSILALASIFMAGVSLTKDERKN